MVLQESSTCASKVLSKARKKVVLLVLSAPLVSTWDSMASQAWLSSWVPGTLALQSEQSICVDMCWFLWLVDVNCWQLGSMSPWRRGHCRLCGASRCLCASDLVTSVPDVGQNDVRKRAQCESLMLWMLKLLIDETQIIQAYWTSWTSFYFDGPWSQFTYFTQCQLRSWRKTKMSRKHKRHDIWTNQLQTEKSIPQACPLWTKTMTFNWQEFLSFVVRFHFSRGLEAGQEYKVLWGVCIPEGQIAAFRPWKCRWPRPKSCGQQTCLTTC